MCGRGGEGERERGKEREREGDTANPLNLDTNGAASVFVSDVSPLQEGQENVSCLERCPHFRRLE